MLTTLLLATSLATPCESLLTLTLAGRVVGRVQPTINFEVWMRDKFRL